MSASICRDAFTVALIADLDCHLVFVVPTDDRFEDFDNVPDEGNADQRTFVISPGAEEALVFCFEYYIGIIPEGEGLGIDHDNFGFTATDLNALLNTANRAVMSIGSPQINPSRPDTTGAPDELKVGILSYTASALATVTNAEDQNLSGELVLNTGV